MNKSPVKKEKRNFKYTLRLCEGLSLHILIYARLLSALAQRNEPESSPQEHCKLKSCYIQTDRQTRTHARSHTHTRGLFIFDVWSVYMIVQIGLWKLKTHGSRWEAMYKNFNWSCKFFSKIVKQFFWVMDKFISKLNFFYSSNNGSVWSNLKDKVVTLIARWMHIHVMCPTVAGRISITVLLKTALQAFWSKRLSIISKKRVHRFHQVYEQYIYIWIKTYVSFLLHTY